MASADAPPAPSPDAEVYASHWGRVYETDESARTREWHCDFADCRAFIAPYCARAARGGSRPHRVASDRNVTRFSLGGFPRLLGRERRAMPGVAPRNFGGDGFAPRASKEERMGCEPSQCRARLNPAWSAARIAPGASYADLVEAAASLPVPEESPALKTPKMKWVSGDM